MRRFTHLGRIIDPRVASNLWAILGSASLAGIAFLFTVTDVVAAGPFTVGAAAFLSWVLAREYDPDHPMTANISLVLGGVGAAFVAGFQPLTLYLLIVAMRILVRTTGLAPRTSDVVVHVGLALWAAQTVPGALAGITFAGAMFIDGRVPPRARSRGWWSLGTVVGVVLVWWAAAPRPTSGQPIDLVLVVFLVAIVVVVARFESVDALGDHTGEPLDPARLRLGRERVSVAMGLIAIIGAVGTVLPGVVVVAATAVRRLIRPRATGDAVTTT